MTKYILTLPHEKEIPTRSSGRSRQNLTSYLLRSLFVSYHRMSDATQYNPCHILVQSQYFPTGRIQHKKRWMYPLCAIIRTGNCRRRLWPRSLALPNGRNGTGTRKRRTLPALLQEPLVGNRPLCPRAWFLRNYHYPCFQPLEKPGTDKWSRTICHDTLSWCHILGTELA